MITVVQNFICTKRKRLELLKSELPNMSKVFKDYEFFVNYGSIENVFEVGQVYEDNIKKLSFENNLEENWGEVTLGMVNQRQHGYGISAATTLGQVQMLQIFPQE